MLGTSKAKTGRARPTPKFRDNLRESACRDARGTGTSPPQKNPRAPQQKRRACNPDAGPHHLGEAIVDICPSYI